MDSHPHETVSPNGLVLMSYHSNWKVTDKVDPGTFIEVDSPLKTAAMGAYKFSCMAKVVATVDIKNGAYHSELRCEFENIGREQRELVVKYVFEEQKRRLRKE